VPKVCILGLGGPKLSSQERDFFAEIDPLGFILFDRNCETPDQVRTLTTALRDISGRADAPILIDQEGGRVARLKSPNWRVAPPAAVFGDLHSADPCAAARAAWLNARLIGAELHGLGINVNCAPVLDIPVFGADPIIGDRAFSTDAATVAVLGTAYLDGLCGSGVLAVIKHIPGHGRAGVDSHLQLPRVKSLYDELSATDFAPFKAMSGRPAPQPWAMTAHVVFEAIDAEKPSTLSPSVIGDVIRGGIGFDGILISDDLSMEALSDPLAVRAREAIAAGCDLNLHCNGKLMEMQDVACSSPELSEAVRGKLALSIGALPEPEAFDAGVAVEELDVLFAKAGITSG